jgi:RNA recognition motif-containing protein
MKLLVRNLARNTTEATLLTMFEIHGTVQSCNVVMDKETGFSKGFGFVEMPRQGEAKIAMKSINGTDIDGHKVRVKKAESKSNTEKNQVCGEMDSTSRQDPLHGVTLKVIVTRLEERYGWEDLGRRIAIKCFTNNPSINSCLKFLRKTPWARQKVEALYLKTKW